MGQAAELVLHWTGPSIIAGDFNCALDTLPAFQRLTSVGWKSADHLHQLIHGEDIGSTYLENTRHEFILVSPVLVPHFRRAFTIRDFRFPQHHPLVAEFAIPHNPIQLQAWKLPKLLKPEQRAILASVNGDLIAEQLVGQADPDLHAWVSRIADTPEPFVQWSQLVEKTWSKVLSSNDSRLSKKQTGRCVMPRLKRVPLPRSVKFADQDHYNTPLEVSSVHAKQVTRQVRRLQSLRRLMQRPHHPICPECQMLYASILVAKGFGQNFSEWVLSQGGPPLSEQMPATRDLDSLIQMSIDFANASVNHEAKVRKAIFINRLNNSFKTQGGKLAYQCLRTIDKPEVDCLKSLTAVNWIGLRSRGKQTPKIKVNERLHHDEHLEVNGRPLTQLGDGLFSIPAAAGFSHNSTVRKVKWETEPEKIERMFFEYWNTFWRRESATRFHDPCTPNFDARFQEPLDVSLSGSDLKAAIGRTKTNTSQAADGWSQQDLAVVSDYLLDALALLWGQVMLASHNFGEANCHAKVYLLAKILHPELLTHCRPITVMSLLYRTWAKALTRKVMLQISTKLPPGVVGGVPGRSSTRIWFHLQHTIELGLKMNSPLCGLVADLVKMYNNLPREAIIALFIKIGFPPGLARGWLAFLDCLERHVLIKGSISPGYRSNTGLPEGDPLAVLGAVLFGCAWVDHLASIPLLVAQVYVDNLELTSSSPETLVRAFHVSQDFFRTWGVGIDEGKTWAWEINMGKHGRPNLDLPFRKTAKDLGANMRYGRNMCSANQYERLEQAGVVLTRIAGLPVGDKQRGTIIQGAAFAKAFFGSETTVISIPNFQSLRRKVQQAFIRKGRRASSRAFCALVAEGKLDPFVWCVLKQIRSYRMVFFDSPVEWEAFARELLHAVHPNKLYGPSSIFRRYCDLLDLTILPNGRISFPSGIVLHLLHSCYKDLELEIQDAWTRLLTAELSSRSGAENLYQVDAVATREALAALHEDESTAVLIHLSGGIVTKSHLSHSRNCSPTCLFCPDKDTVAHRVLCCPQTSGLRESCGELSHLSQAAATLPWVPKIPDLDTFRSVCFSRPSPPLLLRTAECTQLVFVDGTAVDPTCPSCDDTAWAVIVDQGDGYPDIDLLLDASRNTGEAPPFFSVAMTGKTQGRQNINRAELAAFHWTIGTFEHCHIVTDSKYVQGIGEFLLGGNSLRKFVNRPNYDLIRQIHTILEGAGNRRIRISKIKSHQSEWRGLSNSDLRWYWGNHCADRAANAAVHVDVPGLTHLRSTMALRRAANVTKFRAIYSQLCKFVVLYKAVLDGPEAGLPPHSEVAQEARVCPIRIIFYLNTNVQRASIWSVSFNEALISWLATLRWPDGAPHRTVLWIELLVSFRLHSGLLVPKPLPGVEGCFVSPTFWPTLRDPPLTLAQELQSFQRTIRSLETLLDQTLLPWDSAVRREGTRFRLPFSLQGFAHGPDLPNYPQVVEALLRYGDSQTNRLQHALDLSHQQTPMCSPYDAIVLPQAHLKEFRRIKAHKNPGRRTTNLPYVFDDT